MAGKMIEQDCSRCGAFYGKCPDTHYPICSRCTMLAVQRLNQASKAERSSITGKMVKAAFKKKKWTQRMASGRLHMTVADISRMATGKEIPSQTLVDFVMETLTQDEIDACVD